MEIKIFRVSCRACNEVFNGMTQEVVNEKHQLHIKNCETIKALEKVERFRKEAERILERKVTLKEAGKLLGIKFRR